MRDSEILFLETFGGSFCLICTLPTKSSTQVINIERYTGRLVFQGIFGKDVFNSSKDALQKIGGDQKCVKNCMFAFLWKNSSNSTTNSNKKPEN